MSMMRHRLLSVSHGSVYEFPYNIEFNLPAATNAKSPVNALDYYYTAYFYMNGYSAFTYNRETAPHYADINPTHTYQQLAFTPNRNFLDVKNHASLKIDFEVEGYISDALNRGVLLMVSSGEKCAAMLIKRSKAMIFSGVKNNIAQNVKFIKTVETDAYIQHRMTAKIEFTKTSAKYYIDGELIYTQVELFDHADINFATNAMQHTYPLIPTNAMTAPLTCFCANAFRIKLYNATYKEW